MSDDIHLPENSESRGLGFAAFDALAAEREPWLPQVFEWPPEFDLMSGARSIIVTGRGGAGKTALQQALERSCYQPDGKPTRLVVEWRLAPPHPQNMNLLDNQLTALFDLCSHTILIHLCHYPALFFEAPKWAQNALTWFIREYLWGDLAMRAGEAAQTGQQVLARLATDPVQPIIYPGAPPEMIIAEFVKSLQTLGLKGAWVLVDGLENWQEAQQEAIAAGLTTFLSTLNLFEMGGFAYKIFMPNALYRTLARLSSVERRRIDLHHLRWPPAKLRALLEKRLTLASGGEIKTLTDLCSDQNLLIWLEHFGGDTPRGWLRQAAPLVAAYFERRRAGQTRPITGQEWKEIRRRHPPQLILHSEACRVTVGSRDIDDFSPGPFALLQYLYQRQGQICSKSEIYYRHHRRLAYEPSPEDPDWDPPASYEGMIETLIWRLRQTIEPPGIKDNVFLFTVRHQGIKLVVPGGGR